MSEAWLEKNDAFEQEIDSHDMEEVEGLLKDDARGALVMTYSGSLINIGPVVEDKRKVEYNSIGIRGDVPNAAEDDSSILGNDIDVNSEVEFEAGPVSTTSAAYKVAVCKDDLSIDEQEEALSNATMILTNKFADINKTLILE
ncbi:MAG: hypothetical protein GY746_18490 [Gammaproteobacteria bacterium]|nr:hypothetical protein [Gammaproteobacteria bacterium]